MCHSTLLCTVYVYLSAMSNRATCGLWGVFFFHNKMSDSDLIFSIINKIKQLLCIWDLLMKYYQWLSGYVTQAKSNAFSINVAIFIIPQCKPLPSHTLNVGIGNGTDKWLFAARVVIITSTTSYTVQTISQTYKASNSHTPCISI